MNEPGILDVAKVLMTNTGQETKMTDWQSQLKKEEVGQDADGTKFVYIKGLRRLAKLRGIKEEKHTFGNCFIWETKKKGAIPFVQMMYSVTFQDGETYSDVADAHHYNIGNDDMAVYTTAIAATRAEARALRKALGIDLVSKEELSMQKAMGSELTGAIKAEQKTLINTLKKRAKITNNQEIIREVIQRDDVVSLDDITADEAQEVIKWLNERVDRN